MDKVGYDAEWAVLNSSDVVPQNRERVYIIGHLRGTSTRQVFPIRRQGTDLVRTNPKIGVVGNTSSTDYKSQNVFSTNSIAATLKAAGGSGNIPKIAYRPCLTPDRINKRQNGRRFKNCEDPAFTLTSQDRHGVLIESDRALAIRKLTPKECWRLQGFSDEQFEKAKQAGVSNSQLYKQAGNAVTVDVVEQIGKRLWRINDGSSR